jgi:hypothetical protein
MSDYSVTEKLNISSHFSSPFDELLPLGFDERLSNHSHFIERETIHLDEVA